MLRCLEVETTTSCRRRRRMKAVPCVASQQSEHLASVAKAHGWERLRADPQLFRHAVSGALLSVFADDLLMLARDAD
eukprot:8301338-Heterocapsa_arctica.AAC.1